MHWQVPPVQVKFSFPTPLGQPHEMVPPQLLLRVPHALPSALTGHVAAVQHTFGFDAVLQVCPAGQVHVRVPPQPLSNGPHLSPPGEFGPLGTFVQV
jgi:hypothetical protein